jgi:tetratricopeptide (TPR) repeat protein
VYRLPSLHERDALALFAERATVAHHGFEFIDAHIEAATDICRRLDGIALAIELAAARLPILGLFELRAQIAKHFRVVAGGRHDLPARHKTLRAAISWSHDLLDEQECALFRRLAIFSSGWTLEAAEATCADAILNRDDVLGALCSLVERSLVIAHTENATPRYSFFESTREYAAEQLAKDGEYPALAARHAEWMANLADRAYALAESLPRVGWEAQFGPDLDNALAALEWSVGLGAEPTLAGRIASGFRGSWQLASLSEYGQRYLDLAVERIDADEHPVLVAKLLIAQFRFLHGAPSVDMMEYAIALLGSDGDPQMLARAEQSLAFALNQTGSHAEALEASLRASDVLRGAGLERSAMHAGLICGRSEILRRLNRIEEAKEAITEALAIAEEVGDAWPISHHQSILADMEFHAGNARAAVDLMLKSVRSVRFVRGAQQEFYALCNLACYQLALGEIDEAYRNACDTLKLSRRANENVAMLAMQHLATVAALRKDPERAARLLGHVNAWFERTNCTRDQTDIRGYTILMESLRGQLSEDEVARLCLCGAQLSQIAAIDEAIRA